MKVAINKDGEQGLLFYHKGKKQVTVFHPNEKVRESVRGYLKTKRPFTMGDEGGSRTKISAVPTQHINLMNMALCEMGHRIGVNVDWDHPDNIEDITDMTDSSLPVDTQINKSWHDLIIHLGGEIDG